MNKNVAYKGFNKSLVCKGKQYAENMIFEEDSARICHKGMHYCKNPFYVLAYYPLINNDGNFNEFAIVKPMAKEFTNDNKKYCTTKLKVGAKLSSSDFIAACIEFAIEKTASTMLSIKNSDNNAIIGSSVDNAKIMSSGDHAQIGSSGDYTQIENSGDVVKIMNSGNHAQIGSFGDYTQIGSTGDNAIIESTGSDTVICCTGFNSKVKAQKGSWITLSEWIFSDENENYTPKYVKTEYVDGKRIKANTFYKLINGEFTEVRSLIKF